MAGAVYSFEEHMIKKQARAEEAMLKAVTVEKSFVTYVLADSSKFDKVSAVSFGSLDCACIVTDKCSNSKLKKLTVIKEVL